VQLTLAPLPATEQRKLEAMRADLLKNPGQNLTAVHFISTDEAEVSQEEARVDGILKGHQSVSEVDLIRVFGLTTTPPPETLPQPVSIERIAGTSHKDPLFFSGSGQI